MGFGVLFWNNHSCTVAHQCCNDLLHSLHRQWQSWTPCQRHPSEPIGKIYDPIDEVIGPKFNNRYIKNLVSDKYSGYIFPTYKGLCFFVFYKTFYPLWRGYSLNSWNDFDAQYLKRRRLEKGGAVSMTEKMIHDLDLQKVKFRHCVRISKFWWHFSRTVQDIEKKSVYGEVINGLPNFMIFSPEMTFRGQRSRSNLEKFDI